MTKSRVFVFVATLTTFLLVACKPSVPSQYIAPDELEEVLYDYYVSQAMADVKNDDGRMGYHRRMYFLAVLKKHGLTEAEFDSSMVYYYRRADYLRKIYSHLQERMEREVSGTTVTSVVHKYRIGGDTADIWRDKRATMLCPSIPYNRYDFELKADTSFRKGDSYLLTFNTDFLYQSGSKDATVCVAVKYENDSIATFYQNVTFSGLAQLRIPPEKNEKVRNMRGFFYLDRGRDESSTLKLMFLNNIQFLRMRSQKESVSKGDTISQQTTPKDSLGVKKIPMIQPQSMPPQQLHKRDDIKKAQIDKHIMPKEEKRL